jgi:hypothetical protein
MNENQNSNQRGAKFKGSAGQNKNKEKSTHPDFKGSQTIDGKDYWVAAWVNRNDDGSPWLSIEHEAKEKLPNLVNEFKKEVGGDPLAEFGGSQQAPAQTQGQQTEDDDVPF